VRFQSLVGKDRSGNSLLPALTFSVVIHSILLWAAQAGMAERSGQLPLAVTLRPAAAPALPAPSLQSASAPPTKISPGSSPARPAAAGPDRAAETELSAAAVEQMPGPGSRAETAAGQGTADVSAGEGAGPDADGIRAYRIGLAREARNHRRYPPLALERGWTGTAEVEVDVSRQGRARQIQLARSSGHEILDREALAMMIRAASTAALPASLRGQAFSVRLPVEFELTDSR
jgi:protein TonB